MAALALTTGFTIAVLPLPISKLAAAESTDGEDGEKVIIVSANRFEQVSLQLPTNITVINSDEIAASAANDLSQLLRKIAGIQLSNIAGKTVVSIRGVSAEQAGSNVLIQIDGRRLNNTDLASPDLESIALATIERIEIVQGSASSLYGDQAVAGVINIVTKDSNTQATTISIAAGSYNQQETNIHWSNQLSEAWAILVSANYAQTDNYRQHNEQTRKQLQAKLNYQTENTNWLFEINNHQEDLQTPGALLESDLIDRRQSRTEFANDFVDTKRDTYRLFGQQQLSSDWEFALDINHSESDIDSINSFIGFSTNSINTTEREQFSIYPRFKYYFALSSGQGELVFGIDHDNNDYDFSLLNRSNEQTINSFYVQSYLPLTQQTQLQLGARYARVEDKLIDGFTYANGVRLNNNAQVYDIGLSHQISEKVNLYSRYSQNFRFAKVDEQAYTSPAVTGLDPQKGYSLELGLTSSINDHQFDVSIYKLRLKDEIFFDQSALPPTGAFFPGANVNGGLSERLGGTIAYQVALQENFGIGANYHYVDAKLIGALTDSELPGVSKQTANLWFDWKLTDNWNWYFETNYRSDRFQEGDLTNSQDKIEGYTLVNAAINYQWSQWRFSLRIDNLFNKKYIDYAQFAGYYPAKERNGYVKLSYSF